MIKVNKGTVMLMGSGDEIVADIAMACVALAKSAAMPEGKSAVGEFERICDILDDKLTQAVISLAEEEKRRP
jgi:hypothetical protein